MPHQCIRCGKVYPNGSKEILAGCSVCGGRKFYYIAQPVDEEERKTIEQQVEQQAENILEKVIQNIPEEKYNELGEADEQGEWVKINPDELDEADRERVERIQSLQDQDRGLISRIRTQPAPGKESGAGVQPDRPAVRKRGRSRKLRVSTGRKRIVKPARPEVITVVEKGVYEINIKALLANSPIIVQKDGSYLIHLPSLFNQIKEE